MDVKSAAELSDANMAIAFVPSELDLTGIIPGKCIVAAGLSDIKSNLSRLWDFLSPEGIAQGTLASFLDRVSAPSAPRRLSTMIPGYPQYIQASALQQS